jgi:hypothetical protein
MSPATTLLHAIEHLRYHYTFGTLLSGVGWQTSLARGPEPTGACSARV